MSSGHLGFFHSATTPVGRGFDSSLGYLGGGEDHYTQQSGGAVDLWRDHQPAYGENGTFSGYLYAGEAVKVIEEHAAHYAAQPLFMYLAWHLVHSPLEAPAHYFDPKCADNSQRQLYHAMATAMDEGVGNVSKALKSAGMFDTTLMIFSADK